MAGRNGERKEKVSGENNWRERGREGKVEEGMRSKESRVKVKVR
jgi:hypothetical protein